MFTLLLAMIHVQQERNAYNCDLECATATACKEIGQDMMCASRFNIKFMQMLKCQEN